MLVVHHLGVSQSERIVWLCEELGIPYDLRVHDRDPETRLAPASLKALHPAETAPVIVDGDIVMAESGAIVEYILARYGKGRLVVAPDAADYADYVYWLHFSNGSLMPSEMAAWVASAAGAGPDVPIATVMKARADRAYSMVEDRLGKAKFLAGDALTAADIMMVFALSTMRAFTGRELAAYPNIRRYLALVGERPAYRRAMAKGDPSMPPMLA